MTIISHADAYGIARHAARPPSPAPAWRPPVWPRNRQPAARGVNYNFFLICSPFICPKRVPKRHLTRDIINTGSRPVANGRPEPYALSDGYPVGRSETTPDFVHTFQTPKKSEVQKQSPFQSQFPTPATDPRVSKVHTFHTSNSPLHVPYDF